MSGFQFKQFNVQHDHCAMKVGTDSILLGAWVALAQVRSVLDMGCGSGLLALMAAQRLSQHYASEQDKNYRISAIEIDPAAAQQAQQNVRRSKWADKIQVVQQDLTAFAADTNARFDLIVANPPYFAAGVACRDLTRQTARYATPENSHLHWLQLAQKMLNPNGRIAFVLPFEAAEQLLQQLEHTALCCTKRTEVITKQGKPPQRLLVEFRLAKSAVRPLTVNEQITIYQRDNRYHQDFIDLTKAFYLKF
ncbi:tRNA1Val (adenine37-N6)-methyltransferase [Pasteurella testudinis DSM 23072]|uniref:tRNA1(Val) (adenine(37)-N6)-methyltransferase n=1 Tax=Pasteurella testudinis DSM 23072 TaxID=1122938 RepID=A0A1W1VBJ9_9PAST|nr:methyltransferase [Pasteurella testudinis]SMB90431.1 tRNA1Val (adenine37-N6)-methyltransferase [Pasteurella testudinis DSM 23072]SUB52789.1 tRNA (adenine-N(6)-)-methyltransferase [Pasteurella testudinis]